MIWPALWCPQVLEHCPGSACMVLGVGRLSCFTFVTRQPGTLETEVSQVPVFIYGRRLSLLGPNSVPSQELERRTQEVHSSQKQEIASLSLMLSCSFLCFFTFTYVLSLGLTLLLSYFISRLTTSGLRRGPGPFLVPQNKFFQGLHDYH